VVISAASHGRVPAVAVLMALDFDGVAVDVIGIRAATLIAM
jgi:hypothetical protein